MRRKMSFCFILGVFVSFYLLNVYGAIDETEITKSGKYIWGRGEDRDLPKADKAALNDLISQISVTVKGGFTDIAREQDGQVTEVTEQIIKTYSNTTLHQAQRIVKDTGKGFIVYRYISTKDRDSIFKNREKILKDYVKEGEAAEKECRVGDALRNYYWALLLLRTMPDYNSISYDFTMGNIKLLSALPNKINRIFSLLSFDVKEVRDNKNKKTRSIFFRALFDGKEANNLDFQFSTGYDISPMQSICGTEGLIELYGDSAFDMDKLTLYINYRYEEQSRVNKEVNDVFQGTYKPGFPNSKINMLLKKVRPKKEKKENISVDSVNFLVHNGKIDESKYAKIFQKIFSEKDKSQLKTYFTEDGYKDFQGIVTYGDAKLLSSKVNLEAGKILDDVIIRGLTMCFTFPDNQKQITDKLVFIFDENDKIKEVNFALGDIAIKNIMTKSENWGNIEEKQQIIRFMEIYKTAYSLKNLEFIKSIFSEDALIIVGKKLEKSHQNIADMAKKALGNEMYEFVKKSKAEYMESLKMVFGSNEYVNIQFEDTNVRKARNDRKVYGIQLKQNYYSSNYADQGYLFLMFDITDMKKPLIQVRSWQPEKNPDGSIIGVRDFVF